MKKFLTIIVICLMSISMSAQRAAVMEFKPGVGVSQSDVDGLCGMFTTGFRPSGYTIIERSQVDRVISEQNMQRSRLTESQMIHVGELLNLSCIVIGDVNVVMGEYNVDVRVVNVESGVVIATAGKAMSGSYGENMRSLAQTLAGKIAIKSGPTVQPQRPVAPAPDIKPTEPTVLYGYLKVFPNDLGTFDSKPKTIIANINKSQQYGYDTWRLPTIEELNLLKANGLISGGGYMASDGNQSGKVRLVTDKESAAVLEQESARKAAEEKARKEEARKGYVDLGLPSGTLWKINNEEGGLYTYDQAWAKFGNQMPTKAQMEELVNKCKWVQVENGYKVTGPSGKYVVFPASGLRTHSGSVHFVGDYGFYWSSSTFNNEQAFALSFQIRDMFVLKEIKFNALAVRLVKIIRDED